MEYPQVKAFETYLVTERGLAPATVEAYKRDVTSLANVLRRRGATLDSFTAEDVREWLVSQSLNGAKVSSITRRIMSVRSFLQYQEGNGRQVGTILAGIDTPKAEQPLPKALGRHETDDLLAAPMCPRDAAMLETLYATGMRVSELCDLTLANTNLEHGYVRVFGKGDKERLVPLGDEAIGAIKRYLPQRPASTQPYLFLSVNGNRMCRGDVGVIVNKAQAKSGLKKGVSPHTLRHCFASHMLSGGADLRTIQEMMGHASVETTQTYLAIDIERLRKMHALHPRN